MIKTIRAAGAVPMFLYLEGVRDTIKQRETDDRFNAFAQYWFSPKVYCVYTLPYLMGLNSMQLQAMGLGDKSLVVKRKYGHFSPREHFVIAYSIKDFLEKYGLLRSQLQ